MYVVLAGKFKSLKHVLFLQEPNTWLVFNSLVEELLAQLFKHMDKLN